VQKVKSMEDVQRTYSPDDEFRDLYVGLGVDGTKSKEECMNLVETIKGLQKDVQSYKADNERLMRAKEQQDDFNVKLMQSLDIIENKMDKET
jgi:predicted RNase H-like nuclease (RuvC/YqgF family)